MEDERGGRVGGVPSDAEGLSGVAECARAVVLRPSEQDGASGQLRGAGRRDGRT